MDREVKEETGLTLLDYKARGIVTFVYGENIVEYMHLFTSDRFEGEIIECDEGELTWVPISEVCNLPIWEGDKVFFGLLEEKRKRLIYQYVKLSIYLFCMFKILVKR